MSALGKTQPWGDVGSTSARRLIVRYREIASAPALERWPAEAAQTKAPALASERGRTQRAEGGRRGVLPLASSSFRSRAGCRRPGRGISAGGGGLGSGPTGPHVPLLLLRLEELAIIWRVEIKKSAKCCMNVLPMA